MVCSNYVVNVVYTKPLDFTKYKNNFLNLITDLSSIYVRH